MPTNDERREVARGLREEFSGWGCTSFTELAKALSAGDDDLFDEVFDDMGDVKYEVLTDRLADLIEPEKKRSGSPVLHRGEYNFNTYYTCPDCGEEVFPLQERYCSHCGMELIRDAD